jgi:23S rRNA (cytidine2498-2'-O)-methyltransferase
MQSNTDLKNLLHNNFIALLASKDFASELESELKLLEIPVLHKNESLFFVDEEAYKQARRQPIWVQDTWRDCKLVDIKSIGDAKKQLKAMKRLWVHYSWNNHRRAELILEGLSTIKSKPLLFRQEFKKSNYGIFGLIDDSTLFYSLSPSSLVPFALYEFAEDKSGPPSRAYLKLWEVFTIHASELADKIKDKIVLDLGACPGGWTYVLSQLGATVIAIDKAPLDDKVAQMPGVSYRQESAFGIVPELFKPNEMPFALFSDVICYPERLYNLVEKWHQAGLKNMVCTLKFQGETDYASVEKFLQIENSKIIHQYHNKHEVTWVCWEE